MSARLSCDLTSLLPGTAAKPCLPLSQGKREGGQAVEPQQGLLPSQPSPQAPCAIPSHSRASPATESCKLHFPKQSKPRLTAAGKGAWPLLASSSSVPPRHFPLPYHSINTTIKAQQYHGCDGEASPSVVHQKKETKPPTPPTKTSPNRASLSNTPGGQRGTWDDSGWQCQLKAPCLCQSIRAAFINIEWRARGSAGHRAGGASVSLDTAQPTPYQCLHRETLLAHRVSEGLGNTSGTSSKK